MIHAFDVELTYINLTSQLKNSSDESNKHQDKPVLLLYKKTLLPLQILSTMELKWPMTPQDALPSKNRGNNNTSCFTAQVPTLYIMKLNHMNRYITLTMFNTLSLTLLPITLQMLTTSYRTTNIYHDLMLITHRPTHTLTERYKTPPVQDSIQYIYTKNPISTQTRYIFWRFYRLV